MTRLSRRTATTTRFSPKAGRNRRRQGIANILSGGLLPRKHSPDGATAHIRLNGLLLIYRPQKEERLSWPSWLTCSGRFTHTVVIRRLQAEHRTGSVRRPKTGVPPTVLLCHSKSTLLVLSTSHQIFRYSHHRTRPCQAIMMLFILFTTSSFLFHLQLCN